MTSGPAAAAASRHEDSTFRLLLSTDNHLGYLERDPIRGDDSFTTFEEVLRIACFQHDVDAMLLGGDLFHENKPSLGCLVRVSSLLRKYVFGNKPISMELLSDPAVNFPTHALPLANFQDPNLNIALPIFAIHGNHDDPVGGTSALDVLATNACINYFGHTASLEDIHVHPILLRKGNTYLALYGLGHVRDERLLRCFQLKKVRFEPPPPISSPNSNGTGAEPTWFRLLIVHQNRSTRPIPGSREIPNAAHHNTTNNNKLEEYLGGFGMDLVIWGNEHMQQMAPQTSHGYDIIQPGSTIRTALQAQYVSPPKQCGVLEIRGSMYRLTPVTLQSIRPFVSRVIEMAQAFPRCRTLDAVEEALRGVVHEMVLEAEQEQVPLIPDDILSFHKALKFPLLALAVDFSDPNSTAFPQPNYFRLGQEYMGIVANPRDMIRPLKRLHPSYGGWVEDSASALQQQRRRRGGGNPSDGPEEDGEDYIPILRTLQTDDIRTKIAEIFNAQAKDTCGLLSEVEVSAAVHAYVEKEETSAIDERIVELLTSAQKSAFRRLTKHQTHHKHKKTSRKKNDTGADSDEDEDNTNEGSLSYLLSKYGDDAVLTPEAIAAAVARHKREVNRRYAESVQQQAEQAERLERRREALLLEEGEEEEQEQQGLGGKKPPSSSSSPPPQEEDGGTGRRKNIARLDELFDPENMVAGHDGPDDDLLRDPLISTISRSGSVYPLASRSSTEPSIAPSTRTARNKKMPTTASASAAAGGGGVTIKREPALLDDEEQEQRSHATATSVASKALTSSVTTKKEPREEEGGEEDGDDDDRSDRSSDGDSLDELLFATRRMVPAESAVEHALLQAQQFESGLLRRPGDAAPPAGPSASKDSNRGGKRTRATPKRAGAGATSAASGRGFAPEEAMTVVIDSDEDDRKRRSSGKDRGEGGVASGATAAPSKRRRVATGEQPASGGGGGRGRGGRSTSTRVKKENHAGLADLGGGGATTGNFMEGVGLPLFRPGEAAPSSTRGGQTDNAAVNFLAAWASQK